MSDPTGLIESALRGCAENLGPVVGVELELGATSFESSAKVPEGELVVLPLACVLGDEPVAELTLSSPLPLLLCLARRMLGDENPDKERDASEEETRALGEILNLMGGAVDQAIRSEIDANLATRAREWWRANEPGDNAFAEGEHVLASGSLAIPGGQSVPLCLRLPAELLARTRAESAPVTLIGFSDELGARLKQLLEGAGLEVATGSAEDGVTEALGRSCLIALDGSQDWAHELSRRLRLDDRCWTKPLVLTLKEPTRSDVIRALAAGATQVLLEGEKDAGALAVFRAALAPAK